MIQQGQLEPFDLGSRPATVRDCNLGLEKASSAQGNEHPKADCLMLPSLVKGDVKSEHNEIVDRFMTGWKLEYRCDVFVREGECVHPLEW